MKITNDHLLNPPKKYRPLPFWSWNAKLDVDETLFQIKEMDKVGLGGFFMYARGGLKTKYMSDEWMDNVRASVNDAKERGMEPWGYDENGWPSGFGSGAVTGLGSKYHQKYIYMEITDAPVQREFTVTNIKAEDGKNMHFYYETNRFYIDAMDSNVTEAFIASTHKKYKEALGDDFKKMSGFFTDEPQLSRKNKSIPWSLVLPDEYKKAYGEDLLKNLHHLFITSDNCHKTRHNFWKLVAKLFSENFMKKIYDWCNENDAMLTGHLVLEETFSGQLDSNAACMPSYMYMHIPGVDKLGRSVSRDLLMPQLASVCAQTGKKQVLTESFALCGWDVSFEELKWILEWQMVKGANLLCQHLSGYSLAGIRKRDYPAGHFYQNPWWDDYKMFNDFASRVGMLLAEGEIRCEVLVLHTIASAWIDRCDDHHWQSEVNKNYSYKLVDIITELDKNQILSHLGDESIMEKMARVEGDSLIIGEMTYKVIIVPPSKNIDKNTLALLKEFKQNGGKLIFCGEIPSYVSGEKDDSVRALADIHTESSEQIVSFIPNEQKFISLKSEGKDVCDVQYTERKFEGCTMYYLVNTYSEKETATFEAPGKSLAMFDYMTGEIKKYPFAKNNEKVSAKITLEAKGSIIFFVYDDESFAPYSENEKNLFSINSLLSGKWTVEKSEQNAINLDFCDVCLDGKEKHENIPVLDIQDLANNYEREVNIRLDFTIESETDLSGKTYLVVEEPQHFEILINGEKYEQKTDGYFRDKSFIKLDVSGLIKKGTNKITMITDFVQPREVYDMIKDAGEFEAVKNMLWYDREIEEIYLLGDFGVKSKAPYTEGENRTLVTKGGFVLTESAKNVNCDSLVEEGYPFFTGKITLSKTINLQKGETENRSIDFDRMGAVITKLSVNGKQCDTMLWAPYQFDLSNLLSEGENKIEIELTSNFRNLLGPLHLGCDDYLVTPSAFFHKSKIFGENWASVRKWIPEYAFLENGIFLK